MHRRNFIKHAGFIGGGVTVLGNTAFADAFIGAEEPWFDKSMRWAQLAFVENDPGRCDPDFWLNYFDRIHADGVLLSAGGIVAFYPTEIPYHHRSAWLGNNDFLGSLVAECRKKIEQSFFVRILMQQDKICMMRIRIISPSLQMERSVDIGPILSCG